MTKGKKMLLGGITAFVVTALTGSIFLGFLIALGLGLMIGDK
jgi:ABC-type uncharacterized transport system permease subunit